MAVATEKPNPLKGKGGLIAVGAVILLGVVLMFDFKAPESRDPDSTPRMTEYLRFRAAELDRVEVKREDGGFTLLRKGRNWTIDQPRNYRANPTSVDNWLKGLLDDAFISRQVDSKPGALADYGLDKPAAELVLHHGSETRTLKIGSDFRLPGATAPGNSFYALEPADGRLFLITSSQADDVKKKKLDDLRDKRLMEIAEEKNCKSLLIRGAAVTEVRRVGDNWELSQPFRAPAEKWDVESLLAMLRTSESDGFAADEAPDLAEFGLDKPQLQLEVEDNTGKHALLLGKENGSGKIFAVRGGEREVFLVPKTTLDNLNKKPSDLRERRMVTLERDKIRRLEVQNAHGTIRLEKTGDGWNFATAANAPMKQAKADAAQKLVDAATTPALRHVEEAPTDLARHGLDAPLLTITLSDGVGSSQVLKIGRPKGDPHYYAKGQTNAVYEIQGFVFTDLDVKPEALNP